MRSENGCFAAAGVGVALVCLVALATPPKAAAGAADLSRRLVGCRAAIAGTVSRYFQELSAAREGCVIRLIGGQVNAATNCIDGRGDGRLARRLDAIEKRIGRTFPNRCNAADLVPLGFPGSCTDLNGAPFDTRDLQACIRDEGAAIVSEVLRAAYPPGRAISSTPQRACVRGVGRKAVFMFRESLQARVRCLAREERGTLGDVVECRADIPPYGPGTGDRYTDSRIERAYTAVLAGVSGVCSGQDVSQFGYGDDCIEIDPPPFTENDLKSCVFDRNRALLPAFVELAFPSAP